MLFKIGNRNIASFEEVEKFFKVYRYSDDMGHETYLIELHTLEDLISLGAICHSQLDFYSGVQLCDDTITIRQDGDEEWV